MIAVAPLAAHAQDGAYRDMRAMLDRAGLNRRDVRRYVPTFVGMVAMAAAAVALLFVDGPARWLAAPLMALVWLQLGLLGHDSGHNQVFESTAANRRLGLFCFPLMLGMAFRPWVILHNQHHVASNEIDEDPDLTNPLLVFHDAQDGRGFGVIRRFVVARQATLYFPLGTLATIAFRVQGWRYVLGRMRDLYQAGKFDRERPLELALMLIHPVLYLVLPSMLLGPLTWLPLWLVGQLMLGLCMAIVFAPNHKGMRVFGPDEKVSFLEQQVTSSRNVSGSWLVDWFHGGLNYQIEHHLFPRMSRWALRDASAIIRAHCRDAGLEYSVAGVGASWREILASLDQIGKNVLRNEPA